MMSCNFRLFAFFQTKHEMNIVKSENNFLKAYIQNQKCKSVNLRNQDSSESIDESVNLMETPENQIQINNNFNNYFYSYSNFFIYTINSRINENLNILLNSKIFCWAMKTNRCLRKL